MNGELTDAQIDQQDFVDNTIWEVLNNIYRAGLHRQGNEVHDLPWDIEDIGEVRDAVISVMERRGIPEHVVYP